MPRMTITSQRARRSHSADSNRNQEHGFHSVDGTTPISTENAHARNDACSHIAEHPAPESDVKHPVYFRASTHNGAKTNIADQPAHNSYITNQVDLADLIARSIETALSKREIKSSGTDCQSAAEPWGHHIQTPATQDHEPERESDSRVPNYRNAMSTVQSLASPEKGEYKGSRDSRSAASFESICYSTCRGMPIEVVFAFLQRWTAPDVWERIELCTLDGVIAPTRTHYEIAVKEGFTKLKKRYDTTHSVSRLLNAWSNLQQNTAERVEDYCHRVRQLVRERKLMGVEAAPIEMLTTLRRGVTDPRLKLWLSLQSITDFDTLEDNLITYANDQIHGSFIENYGVVNSSLHSFQPPMMANAVSNVRRTYTTGCARCRSRDLPLHPIADCPVETPHWWNDQTCRKCGRVHESVHTHCEVKRECIRCHITGHTPVVCGIGKPSAVPQANIMADKSGLTSVTLTCGTQKIEAVIDTGASQNFIAGSLFTSLRNQRHSPIRDIRDFTGVAFQADKSPLPVSHEAMMHCTFPDGTTVEIPILIVETLHHSMLLSAETLRGLGAVWSFQKDKDHIVLGSTELQNRIAKSRGFTPMTDGKSRQAAYCNCLQVSHQPEILKPTPLYSTEEKGNILHTSLIPWKSTKRPMYNFHNVKRRDERLKLSEKQKIELKNMVSNLEKHGVLELVEHPDTDCRYYLPIRLVWTDSETTPLRLTLDAREFNEYVHRGVGACSHMSKCFLSWRAAERFVCTDLTKAFYSINIHHPERKWFSLYIQGNHYRFARLPMGLTYSPTCLEEVLKLIESQYFPVKEAHLNSSHRFHTKTDNGTNHRAERTVPTEKVQFHTNDSKEVPEISSRLRSICDIAKLQHCPPQPEISEWHMQRFVDDVHYGGHDQDSCIRNSLYDVWKLSRNGFVFNSNKTFGNLENCPWVRKIDGKVLGHMWTTDENIVQIFSLNPEMVPSSGTRSEIVSLLSSNWYDPYGLCAEVTSQIRLLQRMIIQQSDNWEGSVEVEALQYVKEFAQKFFSIPFKTPRFVDTTVLRCFCDASSTHWCVDLRDRFCNRVYCWSGFTQESNTIPRSELDALYRGVLLTRKLIPNLHHLPTEILFFTDSLITIQRLRKNNSKLDRYESRRLEVIRSVTVHFLPGRWNPADAPTRPYTARMDQELLLQFVTGHLSVMKHAESYAPPETPGGDEEEEISTKEAVEVMNLTMSSIMNLTMSSMEEFKEQIRTAQSRMKNPESMDSRFFKLLNGLIYRCIEVGVEEDRPIQLKQLYIPEGESELIKKVINTTHIAYGHSTTKTLELVKRDFYWTGMRRDILRQIQHCMTCKQTKEGRVWRQWSSGVSIPWEGHLWRVIGIDFANLPRGKNFGAQSYLSISDYCSKYTVCKAVPDQSALTTIGILDGVFSILGYPSTIICDCGSAFTSVEFKDYCTRFQIRIHFTAVYAPQFRFFEIIHKTIKQIIKAEIAGRQTDNWVPILSKATNIYNNLPYDNNCADLTPALLNLGYRSHIPGYLATDVRIEDIDELDLPGLSNSTGVVDSLLASRRTNLHRYTKFWERRRGEVKQRLLNRGPRDIQGLKEGDRVLIYRPSPNSLLTNWKDLGIVLNADTSEVRVLNPRKQEITYEHRINLLPVHDGYWKAQE